MMDHFDFIIVGSGPSGSALASRLARSSKCPQVLLIEAGGYNADPAYQISGDRYTTVHTAAGYNWGYKTVPQKSVKGRQIDYSRGRGLSGSTSVNFCCYLVGNKEDYNEIARRVGDDVWKWENTIERYKKIETYHGVSQKYKKYVNPMGFAEVWEKGLQKFLDAAEQFGHPINPDLNSGNPLGIGVAPSTAHKGKRVTAASAYLSDVPSNLTIMTNHHVTRVILEDKKAIGVETMGKKLYASRDVILSAGALDTPKLLLLSGIGPADELKEHQIQVAHDLPGVGKGLRDHCFVPLTVLQKPRTTDRPGFFNDPKAMEAAREQWFKDNTGPLTSFMCASAIGSFKSDCVLHSCEFKMLDEELQEYMRRDTVPSYEICTHTPLLYVNPGEAVRPTDDYLMVLAFGMNPQSVGEVRLQSADPAEDPVLDPRLLSHPFDQRCAIEAVRETLKLLESPGFAKDTVKLVGAPKSHSDSDILEYCRQSLYADWHMCGTVKMGKLDEEGTCVDKDFKVVGLQHLRVVDMSIAPLITNNHTQSTAYLIGETAAEKLIAEYDLDI